MKKMLDYFARYFAIRGYQPTDEWFAKAVTKKEFSNRPYLTFARYSNYLKLIKIVKVIDEVESWAKANGFKPSQVTILDVGCGQLWFGLCLASLGYNIVGIDVSEEKLAIGRERAEDFPNIKVFRAEAIRWLRESNTTFNVALLLDTAEHMEKLEEFFLLLFERLSSPGIVLLTVPDGYSEVELFYQPLANWLLKVMYKQPTTEGHLHIQRFSLKRLRRLLVGSGFEYKFISGMFTTRPPFIFSFLFGFRGLPTYLNIKVAGRLPKFMTNSWLVRGIKRESG